MGKAYQNTYPEFLMEKIDYKKVAQKLFPNKIPYSPNKHLFTKVAFDVFRLNSPSVESYWVLEKCDDGEYLVATYDDISDIKSESEWNAESDKKGQNITLSYKNIPIRRFASDDFKFSSEDVHIFKQALIDKLNEDPDFVNKLLDTLPEDKKNSLMRLFPEFAK